MARYRAIAANLKTRIAAGFEPGDQLPPITALMEHYKVPSLNTIRRAQQLLVAGRRRAHGAAINRAIAALEKAGVE